MNVAILPRLSLLALGLAAALGAQTVTPLSVTPNPASAAQAFTLTLLGISSNVCYNAYSRESVTVSGTRIDLRYTQTPLLVPQVVTPGVVCPVVDPVDPVVVLPTAGPQFAMPPLKAGSYEVWATNVPECIYSGCKIALNAVSAGTLVVRAGTVAKRSWRLKEKSVAADKAFEMQLVKDSLAACTSFSHATATVSIANTTDMPGAIHTAFLVETGKCALLSTVPMGPTFSLPALKAGLYPVYVEELLPCQVTEPMCLVAVKDSLVDTLIVAKSLAIRMSALRALAPKVDVRNGIASFALPAGAQGRWRAELVKPDGGLLATSLLYGKEGDRVSLSVAGAPVHGVALLRLTSPAGAQSILPVLR